MSGLEILAKGFKKALATPSGPTPSVQPKPAHATASAASAAGAADSAFSDDFDELSDDEVVVSRKFQNRALRRDSVARAMKASKHSSTAASEQPRPSGSLFISVSKSSVSKLPQTEPTLACIGSHHERDIFIARKLNSFAASSMLEALWHVPGLDFFVITDLERLPASYLTPGATPASFGKNLFDQPQLLRLEVGTAMRLPLRSIGETLSRTLTFAVLNVHSRSRKSSSRVFNVLVHGVPTSRRTQSRVELTATANKHCERLSFPVADTRSTVFVDSVITLLPYRVRVLASSKALRQYSAAKRNTGGRALAPTAVPATAPSATNDPLSSPSVPAPSVTESDNSRPAQPDASAPASTGSSSPTILKPSSAPSVPKRNQQRKSPKRDQRKGPKSPTVPSSTGAASMIPPGSPTTVADFDSAPSQCLSLIGFCKAVASLEPFLQTCQPQFVQLFSTLASRYMISLTPVGQQAAASPVNLLEGHAF